MKLYTVQTIRDTFGAHTIETWLDREGFDDLEEAVVEWGAEYVFDQLDDYANGDPEDHALTNEDNVDDIFYLSDDDDSY